MANALGITQSRCSPMQNVITEISKKEIDKMIKLLDAALDGICEQEDGFYY